MYQHWQQGIGNEAMQMMQSSLPLRSVKPTDGRVSVVVDGGRRFNRPNAMALLMHQCPVILGCYN